MCFLQSFSTSVFIFFVFLHRHFFDSDHLKQRKQVELKDSREEKRGGKDSPERRFPTDECAVSCPAVKD